MSHVRPLIGLSGRRKQARQVAGFPAALHSADVDVYMTDYARAITEAGGLPVNLPTHVDPAEYRGSLDGILLSGGTDVDPARYGAAPHPALHQPEPQRDALELALVDLAVGDDLPVLGICRGLQLLNVWGGGSLHQHLPPHSRDDGDPGRAVDDVVVEPGTRLHAIYGDRVGVNSLHHQAVDRLADGWRVVARSTDGTVEGLEWPGHDVLAVQWHPEMMPTRSRDPLFVWLVEQAAARAARRIAVAADA